MTVVEKLLAGEHTQLFGSDILRKFSQILKRLLHAILFLFRIPVTIGQEV
jgi:hypothetical protein